MGRGGLRRHSGRHTADLGHKGGEPPGSGEDGDRVPCGSCSGTADLDAALDGGGDPTERKAAGRSRAGSFGGREGGCC